MKVTVEHSAQMAALKDANVKMREIVRRFRHLYSRATIYRHAAIELGQPSRVDQRAFNKGRPPKMTKRDKRNVLRAIPRLRRTVGSFTSPRVAMEAGLSGRVSSRTVRRCLNISGFGYFVTRKKGLMSLADRMKRVKFCHKMKRLENRNFWKEHISFYLDGTGFQFKTRPMDQARAPKAREWRKRSEGLRITMKGQKEGVVNANFMVGISYGRGVVLCQQYLGTITGEKFGKIVRRTVPQALARSIAPRAKRILQDGCPRQNCKKAMEAFAEVGAKVFKIPPRSPDLNPIENWFHLLKKRLRQQALDRQIERETFLEFSNRVKSTMEESSTEEIDRIINSMDCRVNDILKSGGFRTKY